ncbi:membrane lipoprotein lipid attachment site-containing protein [Mesobacillus subterraneus]|uniref:DUF4825 domain-containing protein n=1 Tax=Mesobacillus subterraneus TaxID=285983 RepID=A0A3R9F2Q8_9BACI|nr:membrane lipoprotein lipid attachment site-containing protein [Mesobacillus subterraneus]RSD27752.1 hypothetical protein EJA10_08205 [Mesobacillus subterraneus]
MKKIIIFVSLLLFLSGCSQAEKEMGFQKDETLTVIIGDEQKVTLRIENKGGYTKKEIDHITAQFRKVMKNFEKETNILHLQGVWVTLLRNDETTYNESHNEENKITLYDATDETQFYYVLLLNAILSPYDYSFSGEFVRDGLANYFEEKYTNSFYEESHSIMKFCLEHDCQYPIEELFTSSGYEQNVVNGDDYWVAANQISSFSTFLIDTYGMDKFEELYKSINIESNLENIYVKSAEELENEWIAFLKTNSFDELSEDTKHILSVR